MDKIYKYEYVRNHRSPRILLYFLHMCRGKQTWIRNKVLMNRIHKCRSVDILTETLYIENYERMRSKQIETYNKYGNNKR